MDKSTAPPPPPLPPGPPPPLPPREEDAKPSRLAELFRDHKATLACQLMRELSLREAVEEVHTAFRTVEWAPNAFLLALAQWPATAPRNVFFTLVAAGIECMNERLQLNASPPSPMTSDLAGSLLLEAFHDCRALTCASFVSAFRVSTVHLHAHCLRLLHVHVKIVVTILDVLDMRHLLPLEFVVTAAIEQNDLEAADNFVRDNVEYQVLYLQTLIDRRMQDKAIKKRMVKFNISDHAFPEYHARRMRASLRFLVYNHQFEDILTMVRGNHDMMLYACRFVVGNRGVEDPLARLFVHKSGLARLEEFAHIDTTDLELDAFPNKDELEPLTGCLCITELAGDDCLVFVDSVEALEECITHLRAARVVGFDCEWKSSTNPNQKSEACAVLQLASASRAYVIDTIALKTQCAPLCEIFLSDSIMKLGFDTKGDVTVLARVLLLDGDPRHHVLVRNLVDIQALARRLRNLKRPRLLTDQSGDKHDEVEEGEVLEDGELVDDPIRIDSEPVVLPAQEEEGNVAEDGPREADGNSAAEALQTLERIAPQGAADTNAVDAAESGTSSKKRDRKNRKKKKRAERGTDGGDRESDGSNLSLAAVAEAYLNKPLDKRSRMSDWERRPLTKAQLHYAALDALVLVAIFDVMRQRYPADEFDQALKQTSKPRGAPHASKPSVAASSDGGNGQEPPSHREE